jgi:glycerophosphoryl diester phosphodiesterase
MKHLCLTLLLLLLVVRVDAQEIVVHRGANALEPENTIASADSALAYGAQWIEVDVRTSKDGVLFNLHDETLDRTTNGSGRLSDWLSSDVKGLDAGSWFSSRFVGTPLPTIADMLDHLRGRAHVFFDVKRGTPVETLVKLVRDKGFAKNSFFWFGDEAMLRQFVKLAPEMKIKVNASNIDRLKYWQSVCRPSYVEISPRQITPEFTKYCRKNGIKVMAACQEDDTSEFPMVIAKKADLVNLDRPEMFQPLLQGRKVVLTTAELRIPADGKTLCTDRLQAAIDRLAREGRGTLVFSSGTYLSGQLYLWSGVELHLQSGATLLGSPNPYHYMKVGAQTDDGRHDNGCMALIVAQNAHGLRVTGKGTIDGNGLRLALAGDSLHHTGEYVDAHYNERRQRPSELVRPKLFYFSGCDDVTLLNVHCKSSANWGLSFQECSNVRLQGLDIVNRAYWNNDGIDLTDCWHVQVVDCKVNSADDGICLKSYNPNSGCEDIDIRRCEVRSSASAVKFGTGSWGAFRRIHISDISVFDTFRSAIAIESVDGAAIDSVTVEHVRAFNTGNPIFIRLGHRGSERVGSVRHILIRDMVCEVPFGRPDIDYDLRGPEVDFFHNPFPSSICGIPGHPIEDVRLEDIQLVYPGRASKAMAYMPLWRAHDVPERIDQYPEFTMFGELPAWGFYLRHVSGLTLSNVRLSLKAEDFRPAFVLEDVNRVDWNNVDVPGGLRSQTYVVTSK